MCSPPSSTTRGVHGTLRRITLADAHEMRDRRTYIYAGFAPHPILILIIVETTPLHQPLRLDPQGAISPDTSSQLNLFES